MTKILTPFSQIEIVNVENQLDLNKFLNHKTGVQLKYNGQFIGRVMIKDDVISLQLDASAPNLTICGFPSRKNIFIDAVNNVDIQDVKETFLSTLNVRAKNISLSATVRAKSSITCEAKEQVIINGELLSEAVQCIALSIVNPGKIKSEKAIHLEADEINQQGELYTEGVLHLNSRQLVVHKQSTIIALSRSNLIGEQVVLDGHLNLGSQLFCKVNDLIISSTISPLEEAYFRCKTMQITDQGNLLLRASTTLSKDHILELNVDKIIIDSGAQCGLNHVQVIANEMRSNGKVNVTACNFQLNSLAMEGVYSFKNTRLVVENQVVLEGNGASVLEHVLFEAERFLISGKNNFNDVKFVSDAFEFPSIGSHNFNQCDIQIAGEFLLPKEVHISLNNTFLNTEAIYLFGRAEVENCDLQTDHCVTSQQVKLQATKILAAMLFQDDGANILNCDIKAEYTRLQKKTAIQKCSVETNALNSDSTGIIENSNVIVHNYLHTTDESDLTFISSFLETTQSYSYGRLKFTEDSHHKTHYLQQNSGTITINSAAIEDDGLLFSLPGAVLLAENQAKVHTESALFEGETKWNNSHLDSIGPVIFCGVPKTIEDEVIYPVDAQRNHNQHEFDTSTIQADQNILAGGNVLLKGNSLLTAETIDCLGLMTLTENSRLNAADLKILNKLAVNNSQVTVKNALTAFYGSIISVENKSGVTADNMTFIGKARAQFSELHALSNMVFSGCSESDLQNVELKADKEMRVEEFSNLKGNHTTAKTEYFSNSGDIDLDDLKIHSQVLSNSGQIEGHSSSEFKASVAMYNNGSIHAQKIKVQALSLLNLQGKMSSDTSTTIQAPLVVNQFGHLSSSGRLSIDSLVHVNIFGIDRAYDFNIRSLYTFNSGICLPTLPNGWSDLATYSRITSFARMGLIKLLPNYSQFICLGFMLHSYLKKVLEFSHQSFDFLINLYASDDKSMGPLRKIYNVASSSLNDKTTKVQKWAKELNSYDLLPLYMDALETTLTYLQLIQSVCGAYSEFKSDKKEQLASDSGASPEENKKLKIVLGLAVNSFAPSMNIQSRFNHNSGGVFGVNMMEYSNDEVNDGVKCAWNYSGVYGRATNRGIFSGYNTVAAGTSYENYGSFYSASTTKLCFKDYLENHQGADMDIADFLIQGGPLKNDGHLNCKTGKMDLTNLTQSSTGSIVLSKTQIKAKEDVDLDGQYVAHERTTVNANNITLLGDGNIEQSSFSAEKKVIQQGHLVDDQDLLSGQDIQLDGAKLNNSLVEATATLSIKNTNTVDTGISGVHLDLQDSKFKSSLRATNASVNEAASSEFPQEQSDQLAPNQIRAKESLSTNNVEFDGQQIQAGSMQVQGTQLNGGAAKVERDFSSTNFTATGVAQVVANAIGLIGETHVEQSSFVARENLSQHGHLIGDQSRFSGQNIKLDGAKLNNSLVEATATLSIKNTHTVDTGISGNNLDLRHSKFKSSQPMSETQAEASESSSSEPSSVQSNALSVNQIKAKNKIYTEDVEFDCQQIRAGSMLVHNTSIERSSVKCTSDFTATNLIAAKTCIEADNVIFDKKLQMTDTCTKANPTIRFEENANVRTHDARFEAGDQIVHKTNHHEQTGSLVFKTHDVQTTMNSHIHSGKNKTQSPNAFFVEADTGSFQGSTHLDQGYLSVKQLEKAEDLIGQKGQYARQVYNHSLSVETDQHINLQDIKPRACNISVVAQSIDVNSRYESQHDVSFIATTGDVNVNKKVIGKKVYLESEKNNVVVTGATVKGTEYVAIEAGKNIGLHATEHTYQGKYDTRTKYKKAKIEGGKGNADTDGAGVLVHANRKVIVDASNIEAQGEVFVSGKMGVELSVRSHTYIAEKWKEDKKTLGIKHGKKKYKRTETDVCDSKFISSEDKMRVVAETGEVKGVAGKFIAAQGTTIEAREKIKLKSLITESRVHKEKSAYFGLSSSKHSEKHQKAKLVEFESGGDVRLYSQKKNIEGQDLLIRAKGSASFEAPQGFVDLKTSKLNHTIKDKNKSFTVTAPFVERIDKLLKIEIKTSVQQADPLFASGFALGNADTSLEIATCGFNVGVNGYNTVNALQEGSYGNMALQNSGFAPKVNLTQTETKSSLHYQTAAGGGIYVEGDVRFLARGNVTIEGMPIIADNLDVTAKELEMRGHALKMSHKMSRTSASIGVSLSGDVTDVSVSHSEQKTKATHYENMQVQIKHHVSLNVEKATLDAANIDCETISGNRSGDKINLTIRSLHDNTIGRSYGISASTTGMVSLSESSQEARNVVQVAGIHVRSDITQESFEVGVAHLMGGAVTSDGHNGFSPETLKQTTLHDYSQAHNVGVSGNIGTVFSALKEPASTTSSQLHTVSIMHETADTKALIRPTVYGAQGVNQSLFENNTDLNTTSANARETIRSESQRLHLDVPVEMAAAQIQAGYAFFKQPAEKPNPQIRGVAFQSDKSQSTVSDSVLMNNDNHSDVSSDGATTDSAPILPLIHKEDDTSEKPNRLLSNPSSDLFLQPIVSNLESKTSTDETTTADELIALVEEDSSSLKPPSTFNPRPNTQEVGLKQGAGNQQRFYKINNGQYTNLEKELAESVENSQYTSRTEIVLMEGGEKGNSLYYKGKIDPTKRQFVFEGEVGKQYRFNLVNYGKEFEKYGSMTCAIDIASAEALVKAQAQMNATAASIFVETSLGVMGPSISDKYTLPVFNFMGITLQIEAEASAGVGLKGTAGVGAKADMSKLKVGFLGKIGMFSGVGVEGKVKTEFGIDDKYNMSNAYHEIIENDPIGMRIIEKMKTHQPLNEWEIDHFDTMMENIPWKAQMDRWFRPK